MLEYFFIKFCCNIFFRVQKRSREQNNLTNKRQQLRNWLSHPVETLNAKYKPHFMAAGRFDIRGLAMFHWENNRQKGRDSSELTFKQLRATVAVNLWMSQQVTPSKHVILHASSLLALYIPSFVICQTVTQNSYLSLSVKQIMWYYWISFCQLYPAFFFFFFCTIFEKLKKIHWEFTGQKSEGTIIDNLRHCAYD